MILRLYRIFLQCLSLPVFLSEFLDSRTGKEYGLSLWKKWQLIIKMIWNNTQIVSGSTFLEHITMATSLLLVPKSVEGVVVECGTYKGVSAANLSLICKITNRKLEIFDSFEGLPEPYGQDKAHVVLASQEVHTYEKGSWCGRLEEVKANIERYGEIDVCHFYQGYFENTLPRFKEKCVQVFVDVDYRSSLEDCVKYLWPLLRDNGYFYTHEAGHMEIASLFFSESWWQSQFKITPPGLVGAGTGIGLKILTGSSFASSLAYTIKNCSSDRFTTVPQEGGVKLGISSSIKLTHQNQGVTS